MQNFILYVEFLFLKIFYYIFRLSLQSEQRGTVWIIRAKINEFHLCLKKFSFRKRSLEWKTFIPYLLVFFFNTCFDTFSRILIYRMKNNRKFSARSIPKIIHRRACIKQSNFRNGITLAIRNLFQVAHVYKSCLSIFKRVNSDSKLCNGIY